VITIAVPTGYLLSGALDLLRAAGIADMGPEDLGRRLLLRPSPDLTMVTVRPLDVPAYVDHGSADLGIVGKDALWETERVHYELLDLGFGACRLVMAVPEDSLIRERATWPPVDVPALGFGPGGGAPGNGLPAEEALVRPRRRRRLDQASRTSTLKSW